MSSIKISLFPALPGFETILLFAPDKLIWDGEDVADCNIKFLPFKDEIDYSKLCINIHVSELDNLENILNSINEEKYNNMLKYYETIKHLFSVEGLYEKIISLES